MVLQLRKMRHQHGFPQIGQLTVQVKTSGNLRDVTEASPVSTSFFSFLSGNFGKETPPAMTSIRGEDLAPIDEGYSNLDRIIVRFDKDTNEPDVSSKELLDNLFQYKHGNFDVILGEDYTGEWSSPRNLIITVNIATGATPPLVGLFTLELKAIGGLTDSDDETDSSTAKSPFLIGSFGKSLGPDIISFTVQDEDGGDAFYGNGDKFTLEFFPETNERFGPILSREKVDQLLIFSEDLAGDPISGEADAYTGRWIDAVTLEVTVFDVDGNQSPQVGLLTAQVKASADLLRKDDSEASFSKSPFLEGNFGTKLGPPIDLFEVGNLPPIEAGFSNGDFFRITFGEDTNQPRATTKQQIDNIFEFRQAGVPIDSLGADYVGSWSGNVFEITMLNVNGNSDVTEDTLTVKVKEGGGLTNLAGTSKNSQSESSFPIGNFGLAPGPAIISLEAFSSDPIVPGFSDGDFFIVRFDVDTNKPFENNLNRENLLRLLTFTQSIGDNISGEWLNARTLKVTVVDSTTELVPILVELRFIVKQEAGLVAVSGSESSNSISSHAFGNFGLPPGPPIIKVTAKDPFGQGGADAEYGPNDIILIELFEETNQQVGIELDKSQVDALFLFSVNLGDNYVGRWSDAKTFEITLVNVNNADLLLVDFPQSPTLRVTVKESANVQALTQATQASISQSSNIVGDFGTKAGPSIIGVTVSGDFSPLSEPSDGDKVTISFDEATNELQVNDIVDINKFLDFSQSIGTAVSGKWFNPFTLVLTLDDATGGNPNAQNLIVTVIESGGLKNSANTSLSSDSIGPPTRGNYGLQVGPAIVGFVVDDSVVPPNLGYTDLDTFTIIFDKRTNQPPFGVGNSGTLNKQQVDDLLAFTPDIGDNYEAIWTDAGDLRVTILDSEHLTIKPRVGELQSRVKLGGQLLTADGNSEPSISISDVATGSFDGYLDDVDLCLGGNAYANLPDGKSAQISYAGTEQCGSFSFELAETGDTGSFGVVGETINIIPGGGADCSIDPNCDIAFTFRTAEALASGVDPPDVIMFKDVDNMNGINYDLDSNESFNNIPPGTPTSEVVFLDEADPSIPFEHDMWEVRATTPSKQTAS